jgi:hypothetical protein
MVRWGKFHSQNAHVRNIGGEDIKAQAQFAEGVGWSESPRIEIETLGRRLQLPCDLYNQKRLLLNHAAGFARPFRNGCDRLTGSSVFGMSASNSINGPSASGAVLISGNLVRPQRPPRQADDTRPRWVTDTGRQRTKADTWAWVVPSRRAASVCISFDPEDLINLHGQVSP